MANSSAERLGEDEAVTLAFWNLGEARRREKSGANGWDGAMAADGKPRHDADAEAAPRSPRP